MKGHNKEPMLILLFLLALGKTASEEHSDSVCAASTPCTECTYAQLRSSGACQPTSHSQKIACEMTENNSNTRNSFVYLVACTPLEKPLLTTYFQAWGASGLLVALLAYSWRQQRLASSQRYEHKLKNIIRA